MPIPGLSGLFGPGTAEGPDRWPGTSGALDRLIEAFGRLPGVGAKTAERLAHHLLKCPAEEALALADAIRDVKEQRRATARPAST